MIDDRTTHYDLPQPSASNTLAEDVARLRTALSGADSALHAIELQTGEAGYVADLQARTERRLVRGKAGRPPATPA